MAHGEDRGFQWIADRSAVALGATETTLSRATAVLLGQEAGDGLKAAEQALHELRGEIEELEPGGQADVRATVAVVHLGGDLERLAKLTEQIAEIAWARRSRRPLPPHLVSEVATMSTGVLSLVEGARRTVALEPTAAMDAATALERGLGTVTRQLRVLDEALVTCVPPVDEANAVDLTLLGRCYESCARHAVSAASHVAALSP